jgi:hypothetical protein
MIDESMRSAVDDREIAAWTDFHRAMLFMLVATLLFGLGAGYLLGTGDWRDLTVFILAAVGGAIGVSARGFLRSRRRGGK